MIKSTALQKQKDKRRAEFDAKCLGGYTLEEAKAESKKRMRKNFNENGENIHLKKNDT